VTAREAYHGTTIVRDVARIPRFALDPEKRTLELEIAPFDSERTYAADVIRPHSLDTASRDNILEFHTRALFL
jgi:hypothetical protein